MGKVTGGMGKGFSGKVGDVIYSQHADGSTTVSGVPKKSTKPLSVLQEEIHQNTTIIAALVKPIKGFVRVGWALQGKIEKQNYNNAMVKHVRKDVLTGEYPNRAVDFSKLVVTKGDMRPPVNAAVIVNEWGFQFSWDPESQMNDGHYSDQIMMLAYFPDLQDAEYRISGAQRHQGKDLLLLTGIEKGYEAEIYIAFITDDRTKISDSVYLGKLFW